MTGVAKSVTSNLRRRCSGSDVFWEVDHQYRALLADIDPGSGVAQVDNDPPLAVLARRNATSRMAWRLPTRLSSANRVVF